MPDNKPTMKQLQTLAKQIKHDQAKPVRENERRVRFKMNFKDAVKKMAITPPISNKEILERSKKQRKNND
jgi:hypothetical protein